jgi:hypothetical protein
MAPKKKMFLSWLLINVFSVCLFIVLFAGGFASGVSGPPVYALAMIFILGGVATAWMGYLSWRADEVSKLPPGAERHDGRQVILHQSAPVYYAVAVCQLIGLTGALMGYRQETDSAGLPDAAQAIKLLTLGLGNGLTATLFGVIVSVLIWIQVLYLSHQLEHPGR